MAAAFEKSPLKKTIKPAKRTLFTLPLKNLLEVKNKIGRTLV